MAALICLSGRTSVPSTSDTSRRMPAAGRVAPIAGCAMRVRPAAAVRPRRRGPWEAGRVKMDVRAALPCVHCEGLHRAPAVFDVVRSLEQRLVADHAVVEQRLVARRRLHLEEIGIRRSPIWMLSISSVVPGCSANRDHMPSSGWIWMIR